MSQAKMRQRVELQKLALVNKQARNSTDGESTCSESPRKQGLQLSIALDASPDRTSRYSSGGGGGGGGGQDEQELVYALAAKKRHIVELEHELQLARRDLGKLESQYRALVDPPQSQLQSWHEKVQRTLDSNKGSLTSLLGYSGGDRAAGAGNGYGSGGGGGGGFLKSIVDKFHDFGVDEDEEEEFDRTQNKQKDDFYLKEKHDYDDEEEIEDEETGGTLLGGEARLYRR